MTLSVVCDACGERENARYVEDGECRDCRGVEKPRRPKVSGYVSPDRAERDADYFSHQEAVDAYRRKRQSGGGF